MKWEKRDCPIKLDLKLAGGWEDVTLEIGGDHHSWSVSGCVGDGFSALTECLYVLYPDMLHDAEEPNSTDGELLIKGTEYYTAENKDGSYVNLQPTDNPYESVFTFVKRVEFTWDLEGCEVIWKIVRDSSVDKDFKLHIEIVDGSLKEPKTFRYDVQYSDMCYAVGKALTEALKKRGFGGYHYSAWEGDINVRHLCLLKACGMGHPEAVQTSAALKQPVFGEGEVSPFSDELELLLFDM